MNYGRERPTFAEKKRESMGFNSLEDCRGVYSRVLYRDNGITIARLATWTKREDLASYAMAALPLTKGWPLLNARGLVQIIAQEEQYAQRFSHMHNIVI